MPSGKLQVVTLVGDRIRAAALRQRLAATGHDAAHLTALDADPVLAGLPPYFANVMVITASAAQRASADPAEIGALFSSLRPYGGTACFELDETGHRQLEDKVKLLGLPHAEVRRSGIHSLLVRVGALPDSDNWTHERHSPANSLCSTDTAIKAPMGMLWMGGVASENHRMYTEFLPPAVQVLEGRYIVQGHGIISAIDVYTGRLLWEIAIPKAQYFGAYLDSIKDASGKEIYPPADQPSWEGNHAYFIPGEIELARICGNTFTMVSLNDGIYLAIAEELWVLSPVNGKIMRKMPMPFQDPASGRSLCWGGLRVMGDTLVATAFDPARWKELWPVWKKGNERNKQRLPASWLFAADRSTGELRWKRRAGQGYQSWGVAAGRGRVYAVDSMIPEVLEGLANPGARAGAVAVAELPVIRPETPPTVVGLDLASGRQLWSAPADPLVLDIAYSEKHDLLVLPSRQNYYWKDSTWALVPSGSATAAKISAKRESSVMRALRGSDGTEAWRATNSEFAEPVVINDQVIFTRLGQGFDLSTGTPALRDNAVTGAPEPVTVSTGGCNFLIGSPGFVTHRTCYDEWSVGSTVPFDGIRSGCTPSMIPANGVVSIFNQAMEENTQFRAGGALVHRSDMVNWATLGKGTQRAPVPPLQMVQALGKSVVRLGLDFGAPDDHVEANGRAWVAVLPDPTATAVGKKNPNKSQPLVRFPGEGVTTFILPAPGLPAAQGGLPTIAATGCEGVSECSIRLVPDGQPARRYTVRLHFLEPNERARPGERVFSVAIQGKTVVAEIDLAKEPGPNRACVWTMSGIEVTGELGIALTAKTGRTVLCGMEVEAEQVP